MGVDNSVHPAGPAGPAGSASSAGSADAALAAQPLRRERVAEMLRTRGITPTQQRLDIAEIVLARHQHLSADQVLAMANRDGAAVSKATVYNTLGLFARCGLVREVIVDPSRVFFDSNTSEHYHLYDVDTGELTDIEPTHVSLGELPNLPEGRALERIDLVVRVRRQATAETE